VLRDLYIIQNLRNSYTTLRKLISPRNIDDATYSECRVTVLWVMTGVRKETFLGCMRFRSAHNLIVCTLLKVCVRKKSVTFTQNFSNNSAVIKIGAKH